MLYDDAITEPEPACVRADDWFLPAAVSTTAGFGP